MRKTLRLLVAALFYYSGLVHLARWQMSRKGAKLIILNYHRASTGDLRRHMQYLKRYYRVMHLDQALEELYRSSGEADNVTITPGKDRRTLLALTFDDGYRDNYTYAFKYAIKIGVPITIFLIPGYIDSGEYFWWGEGVRLVKYAQVEQVALDGRVYRLSQHEDRADLSAYIDQRLRSASSVPVRDAFLAQIRSLLKAPQFLDHVEAPEQMNLPLSWAEVAKMQESGWVSFGGHTVHHPVLSCLSEQKEVRYEVIACREMLEEQLAHPIRTFAYPIGRVGDIGEAALNAVREAGFTWAVTTQKGVATPASDPLLIERVLGDVSRHWLLLAAELSGIWSFFSPLWKPFIHANEDI